MAAMADFAEQSEDIEDDEQEHLSIFKERLRRYLLCEPDPLISEVIPKSPFAIKERYLLLKNMEMVLLSQGVKIFGGYIRDMILHHHGAKLFFESEEVRQDPRKAFLYTDDQIHPSSHRDRNTYPRDIDCFVSDPMVCSEITEHLIRKIKGTEIVVSREISCYANHPSFSTMFGCKRVVLEYSYNASLQKKGDKFLIGMDFVYSLCGDSEGPWKFVVDPVCNMLYMDQTGVHSAFEDLKDPVENLAKLFSVVELIKARVTFIPPMPQQYRTPGHDKEILNIQISRKYTEIQAIAAHRKFSATYRILYRMKYLQRILKLAKQGWKLTNLNLKFSLGSSDTNGEQFCSISHEELLDNKIYIKLGQFSLVNLRPGEVDRVWTQTSVLSWSSLVHYAFSSLPAVEEVFANAFTWSVLCPISKRKIDISESRPFATVLQEAMQSLAKTRECQTNISTA